MEVKAVSDSVRVWSYRLWWVQQYGVLIFLMTALSLFGWAVAKWLIEFPPHLESIVSISISLTVTQVCGALLCDFFADDRDLNLGPLKAILFVLPSALVTFAVSKMWMNLPSIILPAIKLAPPQISLIAGAVGWIAFCIVHRLRR